MLKKEIITLMEELCFSELADENCYSLSWKHYICTGLGLESWGTLKKINWKSRHLNFIGKKILDEKYFKTFTKEKAPFTYFYNCLFLLKVTTSIFLSQLFLHSLLFDFFFLRKAREYLKIIFPSLFQQLNISFIFVFNMKLRKMQNSLLWFKGLKSENENTVSFYEDFFSFGLCFWHVRKILMKICM